jgi:hypothetical protein
MVVSHERSGTHFLINAICKAYGYSPDRRIDLDDHLGMNVFAASNIALLAADIARSSPGRIIKSHHDVEFFAGALDQILSRTMIFYVHRNPVDVMISYWRFMHGWLWHEGPKTKDALTFAAAEPEGRMMRYQKRQARNLLHRWARHVEGWTAAAAMHQRLAVVAYDDLNGRYAETVSSISRRFGRPPVTLKRPSREAGVVGGAPADSLPEPDRAALRALAISEVGETMRALGYD